MRLDAAHGGNASFRASAATRAGRNMLDLIASFLARFLFRPILIFIHTMPTTPTTPRKILVTGAAGFIAARVCALLRGEGREVTGLDNFNDAYDRRLKDWRWTQLEKMDGIELCRIDLNDSAGLKKLFQKHTAGRTAPFDAVINLAARAGVRASVENPAVYVEANVSGALNLLEVCREFGVKKFVLASTSSLYGREHPTPYREDMN